MTTLFDMTLRIAEKITDVYRGTGTAGSAITLTDTARKEPAGYWEGGTLWLRSGTHASKFVKVDSFAASVFTFATLTTTIGNTTRYSAADKLFPVDEIIKAIVAALDDEGAWILTENATLTGDGETMVFTLPTGVDHVEDIEFLDTCTIPHRTKCHHYEERNGSIIFSTPPIDDYTINLKYRAVHGDLNAYSDVIDSEISTYWLKWKAIENLMTWALQTYGDGPEKNYANTLQLAMEQLQNARPRQVSVRIRTA